MMGTPESTRPDDGSQCRRSDVHHDGDPDPGHDHLHGEGNLHLEQDLKGCHPHAEGRFDQWGRYRLYTRYGVADDGEDAVQKKGRDGGFEPESDKGDGKRQDRHWGKGLRQRGQVVDRLQIHSAGTSCHEDAGHYPP